MNVNSAQTLIKELERIQAQERNRKRVTVQLSIRVSNIERIIAEMREKFPDPTPYAGS
jgi:hypothetical protein